MQLQMELVSETLAILISLRNSMGLVYLDLEIIVDLEIELHFLELSEIDSYVVFSAIILLHVLMMQLQLTLDSIIWMVLFNLDYMMTVSLIIEEITFVCLSVVLKEH